MADDGAVMRSDPADDAGAGDAPATAPATAPAPRPTVPEDVENALRFVHVMEMQGRQRLSEVSASLYALLETLLARGLVPIDEYDRRRQLTVQREVERAQGESLP